MADGLGIAASVIAVIQITAKVASLGHDYISSVNRAPESLKRLVAELQMLIKILTSLHICAQDPESNALRSLGDPLQQCLADMIKLQNKLVPKNSGLLGNMRARLRWPFEESEVLDSIIRIERLKDSFGLAMDIGQQSRSRATMDRIQGIDTHVQGVGVHVEGITIGITDLRTTQNLSIQKEAILRKDEQRTKVLDWLYPEEFDTMHNIISGRRKDGTGQWILKTREFNDWIEAKDPNSKLLWGYGIPGAGKTFLTSRVIDYIQDQSLPKKYGIAYIYFNFKEQERQKPVKVLASLVKQLACKIQDLPQKITDLYAKLEHEKKKPKFEDLYASLLAIANSNSFNRTLVVCDALDECDPKSQRKELLPLFHRMRNDGIGLFLTSREYPEDIQCSLGESAKLKLYAMDDDIASYIEKKIDENPRAKRLIGNENYKRKIISGLKHCAKGMFLLVHFYIEHLCQQPTTAKILQELEKLRVSSYSTEGKPLDPTYDRAMNCLRAQPKNCMELAMKTLIWIVKARRALKIQELQVAVSLDPGSGQTAVDEQDLPDIKTLLDVCASFVTIDKDSTVRLVHYTVQEYLLDNLVIPEKHDAELRLAMACVFFLSFEVFGTMGPTSPYRLINSPYPESCFISYAAEYLSSHVRACRDSEDLSGLLLKFLEMPSNILFYSQSYWEYYRNLIPTRNLPLYIAIKFGKLGVVRKLLETNNDMTPDSYVLTLHAAVYQNNEPIVRLLLKNGADASAVGLHGKTPLHIAVKESSEPIARLLLENGADASTMDMDRQTPLHIAVKESSEPIARLLLENGADASAMDMDRQTPLHTAVYKNNEPIVQLLLKRGADTSVADKNGDTALHIAVSQNYEKIFQLLLQYGADTSATNNYGYTPLHIAVNKNYESIVQLLLENGADTSVADKNGDTVLHIAAPKGYEKIFQLLLQYGANTSATDNINGETILQIAASRGYGPIVQLLLESGADVSSVDKLGRTALHRASHRGHEQVVQILLENGADTSVIAASGKTPLHMAAGQGRKPVVQLLLEHGADILAINNRGVTALYDAIARGHQPVAKLLLEHWVHSPEVVEILEKVELHASPRTAQ